jgi:endonuclease/exonuclease/phosphatase family metal-dependent hydrolase
VEDCRRIGAVLLEIAADIVALQEVASLSERAGDVPAYLVRITDTTAIEGFTLTTGNSRYGNALLSRMPVASVKCIDISVEGREPRGVIEVVIDRYHTRVHLWATHLGLRIRERHLQVNELLKIIAAAGAETGILLGDFNEWLPWGRPLRALHRWFAPSRSPATFPSRRPVLKLDRIWVRPSANRFTVRAHATKLSRIASDHLPLVADIVFPE